MVISSARLTSSPIETKNDLKNLDVCFICSSSRSGSTHLRLMLDSHPEIACAEEIDYITGKISDSGEFPPLEDYHEWLETDRIFLDRHMSVDRSLNYEELVNSFLRQKRAGKPLLCAVSHFNFHRLLPLWPHARFIHLVRDGRDVAYSCVVEQGWSGNPWHASERWMEAEQLWNKVSQQVPSERKLEITYEDLVSNPVDTLTAICEFLGVSYHRAMLNYPQTSTYDLPDPTYVQLWRQKLDNRQIQLAEARIADMLVARGYELSGLPRLQVDGKMQVQLKIQDRLSRILFRMKRYGLSLFFQDWISRRLPFHNFRKRIKCRINEIDFSCLK